MMKQKKNDYRDFLRDCLEQRKAASPRLSQAYYAQRVGVSKSFLTAVLKKKKHLSTVRLDALCSSLKLTDGECLSVMTSFLSTHQVSYTGKALARVQQVYGLKKNFKEDRLERPSAKERALYDDFLKRTLFCLMDNIKSGLAVDAHKALRDRSFSLTDVEKALGWLVQEGFLQKLARAEFPYVQLRPLLKTDHREQLVRRAQSWFEMSLEMLKDVDSYKPAHVQTLCVTLDETALKELQKEYDHLSAKVFALSQQSAKDQVTIVQIQNLFYSVASLQNF